MHRKELLKSIQTFKRSKWSSDLDLEIADQFIEFISQNKDCFLRELKEGHLTASCWLWNEDESACLFTLHKKLKKWLQLGGHADGEHCLLEVSLKEAKEESGIDSIIPLSNEIFDLHIHEIPDSPREKRHLHYDVRYLLKTTTTTPFVIGDESIDLKWINTKDFESYQLDDSILKMREKVEI